MVRRKPGPKKGAGKVCRFLAALLAAMNLAALTAEASGAAADAAEEKMSTTSQLYALSAVLMDADNGRILLEKNGHEVLPMASTTKIMTCILTLEEGQLSDYAPVSAYAAGQPKVHLGARKGEYYKIEDLLYSLMLESHNDAAVIIAEHYGSQWAGLSEDISAHSAQESQKAVLAFTQRMNEKARRIGCTDTRFVTPNGLDGTLTLEKDGEVQKIAHSTTAADLARIMSYCVKDSPARDAFLKITQSPSYSFSDYVKNREGFSAGSRSVSCVNHNAFLQMMDGALSGKTGFTGKAGYCYVGALERDDRTFVVALLACGWPNNKSWKWHDTKLLMNYGLDHYESCDIYEPGRLDPVPVENGQEAQTGLEADKREIRLLLSPDDEVEVKWDLPRRLDAPVQAGEVVGRESFYVNGELYDSIPVTVAQSVERIDFLFCLKKVWSWMLL